MDSFVCIVNRLLLWVANGFSLSSFLASCLSKSTPEKCDVSVRLFIFMDMQINEVAFKVGDLVWDRRNQTSYRITRLSGSVAYGNDKGKEIASHVNVLMPYSEYAENPEAGYPKSRGRPRTNFDPPVSLADYQAIYYRLFHRELKELVRQLLKDNRPKVVELKTRCREEAKKIAMKRNW